MQKNRFEEDSKNPLSISGREGEEKGGAGRRICAPAKAIMLSIQRTDGEGRRRSGGGRIGDEITPQKTAHFKTRSRDDAIMGARARSKITFRSVFGFPSPKPETLQRLKTICDEQERLTKHLLTHNIYLTKHARINQENTESILISSTSNRASKGTNFKCWINNAK